MSRYEKYNYNVNMIKFKLHDLLWQRRIKNKELAEGVGLAESTVSKIVRGDKDCKLSTIDKICTFLNCKISDIIEFEMPQK